MDTYIDLNIVIIPPDEIKRELITMSEQISTEQDTNFTLNTKNFLPHLSLYSARYPEKNLEAIQSALKEISRQSSKFVLTLSGYTNFNGFIFLDVIKSPELLNLHEIIVDTFNPLREGMISDNMKALSALSEEHKKAIETYGYVSVKQLYMPHITLTSMKDVSLTDTVITNLPNKQLHFSANTLSLTPFAIFGTCPEVVRTFPMQ